MIYKLDHFYNKDHTSVPPIIESELPLEKIMPILACLQYRIEEIDKDFCIDVEDAHLMELLIQFYGAKDVKNQYEALLPRMTISEKEWCAAFEFSFTDELLTSVNLPLGLKIIQLDLYEIREKYCGKASTELMAKHLPNSELFEEKVLSFKSFYQKSRKPKYKLKGD